MHCKKASGQTVRPSAFEGLISFLFTCHLQGSAGRLHAKTSANGSPTVRLSQFAFVRGYFGTFGGGDSSVWPSPCSFECQTWKHHGSLSLSLLRERERETKSREFS